MFSLATLVFAFAVLTLLIVGVLFIVLRRRFAAGHGASRACNGSDQEQGSATTEER